MEGAACRGTVDRADEFPVLSRNAVGVAIGSRSFQPLGERLDRRAVAEVLEALSRLDPNALLLLLDVGQRV